MNHLRYTDLCPLPLSLTSVDFHKIVTATMDPTIGSDHFLSLPRPDIVIGPPAGIPDTTTLAAHDFDVDTRTGFMPPQPPLPRLPSQWESWEAILDDAIQQKLKLGDTPKISASELSKSESWRRRVRDVRHSMITESIHRMTFRPFSSQFFQLQS